jgi:hypothetical protein
MNPIAYAYEADHHCEDCAERRYGRDANGEITGTDSEGNEVGAVFSNTEWWEPSEAMPQTMACGTCCEPIVTVGE